MRSTHPTSKTASSSSAVAQIRQRRQRTLTSIVREEIAHLIGSGQLKAGERINESELALRLDVSRGPVREACRSLEEAGLLVSVVNLGVFVREMSLNDARQLYEVRGALSGLIGRLAAQRITDLQLKALEAQLVAMEEAAERQDMPKYYQVNLAFHDQLMQIADNAMLATMYMATVNQAHLFRQRGLVQEGRLKMSNQEHRAILDALVHRDAKRAEQALAAHVAHGWDRLAAAVQKP
jgi:DNA-binding GntR family transcriptional regulator